MSSRRPFLKSRNVYYDLEAISVPASGYMGVPTRNIHAKYRILVRRVMKCLIFFFTTSKKHSKKKYVDILNTDWEWKKGGYLMGHSRVEISNCCHLKEVDILAKKRAKKIILVAKVKQCLVDRIREAYEGGETIIPRRPVAGSLSIEIAFQEQKVVEQTLKNLGLP